MRGQGLQVSLPAEGAQRPGLCPLLRASALALALSLGGCTGLDVFEPDAGPEDLSAAPAVLPLPDNAVELTQRALDEGRFEDAEKMLERVLRAEPESGDARLILGELFLAEGRSSQAFGVFKQLAETPQFAARAHQGAGIAALRSDDPERALDHLKQAVALDPDLWRAWNALGSYYDSERLWAEADEAYESALAVAPDEAIVYNNHGFSLFSQGRLEESIAVLQQALQIDPDLEPTKANLRMALAWSGRYVHAMSGADDRDMPRVLNNIGYIALMRGDLENAEAYLLRAMEADPSFNEVAWRNLTYLRNVREMRAAETAEAEKAKAAETAE